MTDLLDFRTAVAEYFLANYTGIPAARIDLQNEAFNPPEPDAGEAWGRLAMREFGSSQESLGGVGLRKFEREGSVFFQVFTPTDKGTKEADQLAQEARDLLEGVHLSGNQIWLQGATVRHIGVDGAWYNVLVDVVFTYTETK